ncbi:MAG: hypothetical protein JF587_09470 [Catenulisporales bacterium]|nr:hypothetical protein [Catenulisporales bacterium]
MGVSFFVPETEAAGPLAGRRASVALERRFGGEAVAPVAARVGLGAAWPLFDAAPAAAPPLFGAALAAVFAACVAPAAASDAFALLVVTAVILAL